MWIRWYDHQTLNSSRIGGAQSTLDEPFSFALSKSLEIIHLSVLSTLSEPLGVMICFFARDAVRRLDVPRILFAPREIAKPLSCGPARRCHRIVVMRVANE